MADSFGEIWREVQSYVPSLEPQQAQRFVRDSFRDLLRRRMWSWAIAEGQWTFPAAYTSGTVAVVNESTTVTGTGTSWSSDHEGLQFQVDDHIFTIATVNSPTSITIDRTWPVASDASTTYSIKKAYVTAPADFRALYTVIDPDNEWRINTHLPASALDRIDAGRNASGSPRIVADLRYNSASTPLPMFEVWPHVDSVSTLRYLYWKIATDFSDSQELPYNIDGDVVKLGAFVRLCRWPGTPEQPNPMFNRGLAADYRKEFEYEVAMLERDDNEIYQVDYWTDVEQWPYVPIDAKFIQRHAI